MSAHLQYHLLTVTVSGHQTRKRTAYESFILDDSATAKRVHAAPSESDIHVSHIHVHKY